MESTAKIVSTLESSPERVDSHSDASVDHAEPPRVYLAACGTLCDIFWWARRNPEPSK